jgi:hypothetical protein
MKRFVLIAAILFLPFIVFAQTELTGALGLTFGMNKASVKAIMIDKGGVFDVSNSDSTTLMYTGVTMGTKNPDMVVCNFINNKLYKINILFIPVSELYTQEIYDELEAIITSKYGEPESIRKFKSFYKEGDGNEMDAVKTGNATIASNWLKFNNDSKISLEIKPLNFEVFVVLSYEDGTLKKEVNAKNADEF